MWPVTFLLFFTLPVARDARCCIQTSIFESTFDFENLLKRLTLQKIGITLYGNSKSLKVYENLFFFAADGWSYGITFSAVKQKKKMVAIAVVVGR